MKSRFLVGGLLFVAMLFFGFYLITAARRDSKLAAQEAARQAAAEPLDLQISLYNQAAMQVFSVLDRSKFEWWPAEGTLIGILRYGSNFDISNFSFSPIGTDTDIDVMVRIEDETEWIYLTNLIRAELLSQVWTSCDHCSTASECGEWPSDRPNDKYHCKTRYTSAEHNIYTDIHAYMVDKESNVAFMTRSSEPAYPFQRCFPTNSEYPLNCYRHLL